MQNRQYCADVFALKVLEVDHERPVVQGGTNDPASLSTACRPCNRRKGGRTVEEFEAWSKIRGNVLSIGPAARAKLE